MCTCSEGKTNPMCTRCSPTLTVMRLLAQNPRPIMSSFAERAVPGRALVRNTYNRALLIAMLNDQDLPLCFNGENCKGMLIRGPCDSAPLKSLISPEAFKRHMDSKHEHKNAGQIVPTSCILCLLFNQSAAVSQMFSPHGLHKEPHPTGPVYYFNIRLTPDIGVPEVHLWDYSGTIVEFEGTAGVFKPTFYYNWRDMLNILKRENVQGQEVITLCSVESISLESDGVLQEAAPETL